MAAINWGYAINKPRVIDIDSNNLRKSDEILREMPELQTCIGWAAVRRPVRPATLRISISANSIRSCAGANIRASMNR